MCRSSSRTPERVADFPTLCDNGFTLITSNPSINERGEVAFQGNLRRVTATERPDCQTPEQPDTPRQGVFLGRGGPLTTIAHTNNPPGGDFISEFVVADTSVNSRGDVALAIELDNSGFDQGLFVGSKSGHVRREVPQFHERIRFALVAPCRSTRSARSPSRTTGSCSPIPTAPSRRIVDSNSGQFAVVRPVAEHLRPRGVHGLHHRRHAASRHFHEPGRSGHDRRRQHRAVLLVQRAVPERPGSGSSSPPISTSSGRTASRFKACSRGADPVADKVLKPGDRYAGVPVSSVFTCSEALNNLGQIVMTVQSENPDHVRGPDVHRESHAAPRGHRPG